MIYQKEFEAEYNKVLKMISEIIVEKKVNLTLENLKKICYGFFLKGKYVTMEDVVKAARLGKSSK